MFVKLICLQQYGCQTPYNIDLNLVVCIDTITNYVFIIHIFKYIHLDNTGNIKLLLAVKLRMIIEKKYACIHVFNVYMKAIIFMNYQSSNYH